MVYTDGYWDPIDMTTGSHLSAMDLRRAATGNTSDDDLEQILHFVVSDMGALWTYKELSSVVACDAWTRCWYHPDRGHPAVLIITCSERIPAAWTCTPSKTGHQPKRASSCICGWNFG